MEGLALKGFCAKALAGHSPVAKPREILLVGVAGGGKSSFCKALGNQIGRPTLILDVGALRGSLVGQTVWSGRRASAANEPAAEQAWPRRLPP